MKITTFMTELKSDNSVDIPPEVRDKLDVKPGDKVEITLRKVKSKRLEILISENPLYKIIKFSDG
ncbi:MAG: AbrB/MazE/SpoVT family DNA-binding domain-containing protein [bacterium]|nr:MAG: AbrB/MazE/SpoVT family DNA-binding domain-containing protein [bacterium]